MKPSELMRTPVSGLLVDTKAFSSDDRAASVIGYLRETGDYDAFVEEESRTSIVTIHDLLEVRGLDTQLSRVMRQVPRLVTTNTVGDAAGLLFEYRARSMPVYRGKRLIGKIGASEITGRLLDSDSGVKLSSIMTPDPVTLEPSASVSVARELMRKKKFDQVPVVDGGKPIRVVTSADIVFNLAPYTDKDRKGNKPSWLGAEPVGQVGTADVVTNDEKDPLSSVYENIRKAAGNYSIVTGPKGIVGIVTYRDFMKILTKKPDALQAPMYIVGIPEDIYEANMVREKFGETVRLLTRVIPGLEEARAVIEGGGNNPAKKKNLVKVTIVTPGKQFSYKVFSFELGQAFDEVHGWAKRLAEQQRKGRPSSTRATVRKSEYPS